LNPIIGYEPAARQSPRKPTQPQAPHQRSEWPAEKAKNNGMSKEALQRLLDPPSPRLAILE